MGVDYSGNYGIGIQVYTPDFEIGEGNYTGDNDDIYIVIDNPFEDGYCALGEKANKLIEFLQQKM
jgi:hypothetical protein